MNYGFTVRSLKHKIGRLPSEDSFRWNETLKAGAVADGVTRDPMPVVRVKSLRDQFRFARNYPRPSPAAEAADIFTRHFLCRVGFWGVKGDDAVRDAFRYANETIGTYNQRAFPKPDYVMNDLAGCTAAGAVITGNILTFGFIADSGVAIVRKNGDLVLKTDDEGPSQYDSQRWNHPRLKGKDWSDPETRRIVRNHYRNNLGEQYAFGVLTGEPAALHYTHVMQREFGPTDRVLIYTDGVDKALFTDAGDVTNGLADIIRANDIGSLRRLCQKQVHSEGSLIIASRT